MEKTTNNNINDLLHDNNISTNVPPLPSVEDFKGQIDESSNVPPLGVGETLQVDDENMTDDDILNLWESLRITTQTDVPPLEPAIMVDDVGILTKRDIHGIKAKQKQGKTTVLKVILAALLLGVMFRLKSCLKDPKIFWLDTEQQPTDVKQILKDVSQMTNLPDSYIDEHVHLYPLRSRTYKTLLHELTVNVNKHSPDVVFIDGVVELIRSFNDEIMSHDLIKSLKNLANDCNCSIINVLHENKSSDDENMRGHLGTMLSQAAGTVIQCVKSKDGTITAKNSDSRHAPMPSWSIRYDSDGHIVDADEQRRIDEQLKKQNQKERVQAKKEARELERKNVAAQIVRDNGGKTTREELKKQLMAKLNLGDSTVQEIIRNSVKSVLKFDNGMICLADSEGQ